LASNSSSSNIHNLLFSIDNINCGTFCASIAALTLGGAMNTKNAKRLAKVDSRARGFPFRASRLALALAASGLLAAGSVNATLMSDSDGTNEPDNNTSAGATSGTAGDQFIGCVGFGGPGYNNCSQSQSANDIDFVKFINLLSGATYALTLSSGLGNVDFDLFGGPSVAFDQTINAPSIGTTLTGLTGLTSLELKAYAVAGNTGEGYSASLTKTADASVPEPASAALLAAGLAAAFVSRRRKRS
jgi:hypothetical protein